MFVDLVRSTALSSRLDPEEMGELIRIYQNTVAGEITRFEGHIAKFLGDGVLAYFGWPRAHEDEAERAARAGLSVTAAVAELAAPGGGSLAARVGIATGLVVVGHLVGEEEARERAVVGETPNLAARLQEVAEPGRVVVAEATRRLLGDLFTYRDLDARLLKGFAEPIRAWSILGEGAAESRFDARHGASTTALVGRDQELALLLDRWERAKEGEGRVVLLAGEPGIGKSRLVHSLREALGSEPLTPLRHYCSPYHTNSALYPLIGLLERAAELQRGEPSERQLDKLETMLALAVENVQESAPLLADLLAIPTGGRYRPLSLSPQHKKERIFQALLDQLAGLASRQPVLALYEDVH
jgi:class 3 adenylate cyclase